ncbi:MAG TPA: hypothetical protein VF813_00110, partial [Anaerolineaceae bacterium]
RGRIVLLSFWSAECPWVERVDRSLAALLPDWGERVVYLPVDSNVNESPDLLRKTAGERGLSPVLWDADSALAATFGVEINPHFFLFDERGLLRYQGAFDDINFRQRTPTRNYVQEAVTALMAGRAPETDRTPPYGCTIVRFKDLIA